MKRTLWAQLSKIATLSPLLIVLIIAITGTTATAFVTNDRFVSNERVVVTYGTQKAYDPSKLDTDSPVVTQAGIKGSRIDQYSVHRTAGILRSKKFIRSIIIKLPVTEKVLYGSLHREEVNGPSEDIPQSNTYQDDKNLYIGSTATRTEGAPGKQHVVYEVFSVNGVETKRNPLRMVTDLQPIPRVIAVGKRQHCYPLSNGGNCYNAGQYCRNSDYLQTGIANNGSRIICYDRWEYY
jgi:uncharacterized protein YabE (DUF348 family)